MDNFGAARGRLMREGIAENKGRELQMKKPRDCRFCRDCRWKDTIFRKQEML